MKQIKEVLQKTFDTLKTDMGWKNAMQAIRLQKVVLSVGVGRVNKDKQRMQFIKDRLTKITGQIPATCPAKKSIASFKLREGDIIGYKVTLRGQNMESFIDRFINIALPRSRDFRGISKSVVDEMGNMTVGITEHIIFPETSDEEATDTFGLSVSVQTTATDKQTATKFFEYIGVPFKKDKKD